MISEKDKELIIATLGKHYSKQIVMELNAKEVFNDKGLPFSFESIRQIMSGNENRENLQVEKIILDLVERKIKEKQRLDKRKTRLTKK